MLHFSHCEKENLVILMMRVRQKGNRGETPEPLKEQFISAEKMLHEMGYPVFFSTEYEADDLAGSLAKRFEFEIPVRIITKDRDYL